MTTVNCNYGDTTSSYCPEFNERIYVGMKIASIYDIDIEDHQVALKVDSKKHGGNNNGKLDESEMFAFNTLTGGASIMGLYAHEVLRNVTPEYEYGEITNFFKNIYNLESTDLKAEAIKDFIMSYNNEASISTTNGFFEQMASEWGPSMTNGQATQLLEMILETVQGDDRYCDEYGTINDAYKYYKSKPEDEKFKNSPMAFFTRLFSADRLDNLDEAIKRIYKK